MRSTAAGAGAAMIPDAALLAQLHAQLTQAQRIGAAIAVWADAPPRRDAEAWRGVAGRLEQEAQGRLVTALATADSAAAELVRATRQAIGAAGG